MVMKNWLPLVSGPAPQQQLQSVLLQSYCRQRRWVSDTVMAPATPMVLDNLPQAAEHYAACAVGAVECPALWELWNAMVATGVLLTRRCRICLKP